MCSHGSDNHVLIRINIFKPTYILAIILNYMYNHNCPTAITFPTGFKPRSPVSPLRDQSLCWSHGGE